MKDIAIVLAEGFFDTPNGKGAHGLVRGSDRFEVESVIDSALAGRDAGEVLDGTHRDIPIHASIEAALTAATKPVTYAVVGIATHGGRFTMPLKTLMLKAIKAGLHLVNGLHDAASDDKELSQAATIAGVKIIDLRKPKPKQELHFWSGEIVNIKTPRIAVLGTDCALGKRTTTRLLLEALNKSGISAEMIYTGQTGWMQGAKYGFVLDSVLNDFVSGELEHAIVNCDRETHPDVILIDGQTALRNPSGPCGSELLCSGGATGVILQHAIGREFFEGYEKEGFRIPSLANEISLISHYNARTLAITVNGGNVSNAQREVEQMKLQSELCMPVVDPVREDISKLVPVIRAFIAEQNQ